MNHTLGMFFAILFSVTNLCFGASFDTAKNELIKLNKNAAASQKKIDALDSKTQEYLNEYRSLHSRLSTLETYNKQLSLQVNSQNKEITSLEKQISSIEETKEFIAPLITRMIAAYNELVQKDIPFLKAQRMSVANKLTQMEKQGEKSLSKMYREVMSAYKNEYDFSNNIEAYQGDLDDKKVDFLRVGRVGLYYLSLDSLEGGYYDKIQNKFISLDKKYLLEIKHALKIAKKQSAPNVLILPINTDIMDK